MAQEFVARNGIISKNDTLVQGGLTANTISATTYYNLPAFSGGTITSATNFTGGLSATTISATSITANNISGTTNYVSKFTAANSLGNSLIYDNGTNVGIGTTSPTQKLDVVGSTKTDVLYLGGTSNYLDVATGMRLRSDANGINFVPNGTQAVKITGAGNVGIGTTSPGSKLDVNGDARFGTDSSTGAIYLGTTGGANIAYNTGNRLGFSLWDGSAITERLSIIYNSGNVGIGTTSPAQQLHTSGDAIIRNAYIGYISAFGTNYTSFSHTARTGTNDYSILSENDGTTYINASTGKTIKFRINNIDNAILDSSGNFGIGLTNPAVKLHVNGNIAGDRFISTNGYWGGAINASTAGTFADFGILAPDLQYIMYTPTGTKNAIFAGNVGIGTTAPTAKLEVSTTGNTTGMVQLLKGDTNYGATTTYSRAGSFTWDIGIGAAASNGLPYSYFGIAEQGTIPRLVIAHTTGNVGIGTTNPGSLLTVAGAVSASSFNANFAVLATRSSKADLYGFTGPTLSYYDGVAIVPALTVIGTGNIGIGTSNPNAKLHVSGNALISGNLTATTISATTYLNLPLSATTNTFVTANTFNNATYDLTLTRNDGTSLTSNLGLLSTDVKVSGGTYNINTGVVTFTNTTGGTFQVTGFSSGMTDTFVTGGTYAAGTATFTRSNNASFNVTGFNTGTVTAVNTGNGMNFTNFSTTGTITMGTPSSTTLASTNALTSNSHTHAFAPGGTVSQYITGAGTLVTFPTITNGTVTGSGTDNYIPRFNGTSAIENSIIYDNGSVGIGTTSPGYTLDIAGNLGSTRYYQKADGVPTNNLGNPTVTEMALFDSQFNNKTEFYDPALIKFYTSTDNVTWTEYTGFTTNQKKEFVGGDGNSGVNIPNLTPYFAVEVESNAYVFLNALYMYWSSNSHSTTVKTKVRRVDNSTWYDWTTSNNLVSSWPGHLYMPFNGVPFYPAPSTSTGHYDKIRFIFQPTWASGTYASNAINLYKFQVWGGYPAGKRNVFATDSYANVTFPANVTTNATLVATSVAIGTTSLNGNKLNIVGGPTNLDQLKYTRAIEVSSTDLNNLIIAGFYDGSNLTNSPTSGWFYITVEKHSNTGSSDWVHQTATSLGLGNVGNIVYTRTKTSGTWTAWKTLTTSSDISGTLNKVAKFTGANSLGDSLIFDNGTNVGIGTTAPQSKLQISSINSEYLPSTSSFSLRKNEEGYGLFAGVSGSGNGWLQAGTSNDATNYNLILQSRGGNVGVGTTAPLATLHVSGNALISGNLTATTISATTYYNLPLSATTNTFITANTFNNATYDLTLTRNDGTTLTSNLGLLSTDVKVTGGTYNINSGVVTFTNTTGGTFNVTGFSSGMTDTFVTGGTYAAGTATFTRSNNASFTVTGFNTGTVTNVSALTLGSTGTDITSSVANSTTTPVITLNVPTASASNRGALSSADWTTFNNKQIALNGTGFVKIVGTTISYDNSTYYLASNPNGYTNNTGTVTGSGTANYVPKFTSGTALGNSLIYDNGTNVGIGTTTPGARLHVAGGVTTLDSGQDRQLQFVGTSKNTFSIEHDTSRMYFYNVNTTGTLLSILNGGNVGIGTANPTAKLHVSGLGVANTPLTLGQFFNTIPYGFSTNGTGTARIEVGRLQMHGYIEAGSVSDSDSSSGYLAIGHRGGVNTTTEVIRITPTSNVGIGTTTPSEKLEVNGTAKVLSLTINGGGNYAAGSIYSDAAWGMIFRAKQASPTNAQFMWGDSLDNELMRIKAGNVGIGTTAPVNKLSVASDATYNSENTYSIAATSATDPAYKTVIGYDYSNDIGVIAAVRTSIGWRNLSIPQGSLGLGNIGPTEKLHVTGNIRVTGSYYDSNNSAGTSGQILSSTATGTDWVSLSEITGVDGTGTTNYISKWLDGNTITNSLIFDNGTNVGIGTASPLSKLHVSDTNGGTVYLQDSDSTSTYSITSLSNGGGNLSFDTRNSAGTFVSTDYQIVKDSGGANYHRWSTQGSEKMRIDATGNVGIGTTTPTTKLQIVGGDVLIDNNKGFFSKNTSGSSLSLLKFDTSNNAQIGSVFQGAQTILYATTDFIFYNYPSSTLTERMRITSAGNVGINVSSPTLKFETGGASRFHDTMYFGGSTQGGISWGGTRFLISSDGGNDMTLATNGFTDRVTIKKDTGNVGIGTTVPTEKLEVAGDVKTTNALLSNQQNTSVGVGTSTVFTKAVGSYTAAFFDYVVTSGANARAGTVFMVINGSSVEFAETETNSIGSTTALTLLPSLSGGNILLQATSTSGTWSVKVLARVL